MNDDISVFECNRCFHSWDDYESNRQYRLKKCCVCHMYICKTCFFNKNNKQKCFRCFHGNTSKCDNKCINKFIKLPKSR